MVESLTNGRGKRVTFLDDSEAVYRVVTSTNLSPAINMTITRKNSDLITQKIYFERRRKS